MIEFLNIDQIKKFNEWNENHKNVCELHKKGAIGGRLTYCFTPTGLGTIIKVKCVCGSAIDLTNYETW